MRVQFVEVLKNIKQERVKYQEIIITLISPSISLGFWLKSGVFKIQLGIEPLGMYNGTRIIIYGYMFELCEFYEKMSMILIPYEWLIACSLQRVSGPYIIYNMFTMFLDWRKHEKEVIFF